MIDDLITIALVFVIFGCIYAMGYIHGRWCKVVVLWLALSCPAWANPSAAVAAALNDARSLPPGIREQTRYLPLYAIKVEERRRFLDALKFHVNQLSTNPDFASPRLVTPDLAAVTLADYGWQVNTWERFNESEPYFYVQALVKGGDPVYFWKHDQRKWFVRREVKEVRVPALAPWLPTKQVEELVLLTNSATPIVRADWFVAQTAIQEGRKVGYYDMLNLGKKLADFEALVGLDRKAAQRLKKEIQAVVQTSTVALHNRHILRHPTLTGVWWETFDAKENVDVRNGLRLLNGDFTHDAREIYGTLPNGLFAFFLSDAVGNRANTAPDFIASDGRSSGTDRRVHVGLSCVRCHTPGIQTIDCWARRHYTGRLQLQSTDLGKYLRLKQLYLSDLDGYIRRDQAAYTEALRSVNGLTPADNAKGYAAVWDRYQEQLVSVADVARETGWTEKAVLAAIEQTVKKGLADPVLSGLMQTPPIPIQRQHFEELQPILWQVLGGYKP